MNMLCSAVREALSAAGVLKPQARLLCAVSGGADSTALLHALCRVQKESGFSLFAVHVQHGLRGQASLEDERFVRALCRQLNLPLIVEEANLHGSMDDPGMETLAREERRRIFARQMAAVSADVLLTAHHRDDQSETVLMHLLRGSGLKGLCGMPILSPFDGGILLRPFLSVSRKQIETALLSENLAHREDESNRELITPRNIIRQRLMPQMEALYPEAGAHIAQAAQTLGCDEDFLSAEAQQLFQAAFYGVSPIRALWIPPLRQAHPALVRRVLRKACENLSLPDTLKLESLVHGMPGASVNLPGGLTAVRGQEHIHFAPLQKSDEAAQAVLADQAQYRFRHCVIHQRSTMPDDTIPDSPASAVLPPELLCRQPVLRIPQPDDRIQPLGASGAKPLRRFFTDRKLDPFFRFQLPVLACGNEVLWVPGLCTGEALRLQEIPSCAIHLSITDLPFIPHQSKE